MACRGGGTSPRVGVRSTRRGGIGQLDLLITVVVWQTVYFWKHEDSKYMCSEVYEHVSERDLIQEGSSVVVRVGGGRIFKDGFVAKTRRVCLSVCFVEQHVVKYRERECCGSVPPHGQRCFSFGILRLLSRCRRSSVRGEGAA